MTMINNEYQFLTLTGFFVCLVLFTVMMNTILLKFSTNLGTRNMDENQIRWSSVSKPALGGIGFFLAFLLSLSFNSILFEQVDLFQNKYVIGLISSCSLGFLIGLADDAYNTNPLLKFLGQISCGLILVFTGITINIFETEMFNQILTVLWVVGIMNSINMLDNMDSITTIVSVFVLLGALLFLATNGMLNHFDFMMILGVSASLIGFLFHNWNPSKMFMGDTGSQFLGVLLAVIGVKYFWNLPFGGEEIVASKQIIVVLLAFILPICDTTTVVINRLARKQSPFVGGKDHTTHHLSYLGISDSQVSFVFIGIAAVSMLLMFIITNFIEKWELTHTIMFSGYFALVFLTLFTITKKTKNPKQS